MTDAELDLQFAGLGGVEPPELVVHRTIAAVKADRQRSALRTRVFAAAGMMVMAALTLLVVSGPPEKGDPAQLVERGAGPVLPAVELKVAVRHADGTVERFATNQRYAAGDTLMFRVAASAPATLRLVREGAVLWSGPVPAGETDLPVGYTLEPGEAPARFVVEGGAESLTLYLPAVAP
jgi:hypothetical protein